MIPLEVVDEVVSTSVVLRARAEAGARESALLAHRQSGGRGRVGRRWETVEGNLFLSVLLRPHHSCSPPEWSFLAAVALAETLDLVLPRSGMLQLKWPNDLVLRSGKVAGILVDAGVGNDKVAWVVIGVGVNLTGVPTGLGRRVSCVADVVPPPAPLAFAVSLLSTIERWRTRLETEGFAPIRAAWLERGPDVGSPVSVGHGPAHLVGSFQGLGRDGAMLVATPSGVIEVRSGEVL